MEPDVLPRINRVILSGFLQQEPELRSTPSGVAVSSFRVRTSLLVRDRRGGARETVSFVTVVVWAELAQRICREVQNGQGIYVEGSLHSRSFQTSNGERKTVVEVYADQIEVVPLFLGPSEGRAPHSRGERTAGRDSSEHGPDSGGEGENAGHAHDAGYAHDAEPTHDAEPMAGDLPH